MSEAQLKEMQERIAAGEAPDELNQSVYSYYTEKTDLNDSVQYDIGMSPDKNARGATAKGNTIMPNIMVDLEGASPQSHRGNTTNRSAMVVLDTSERRNTPSIDSTSQETPRYAIVPPQAKAPENLLEAPKAQHTRSNSAAQPTAAELKPQIKENAK